MSLVLPRYADLLIRLRTRRLRPEQLMVYLDDTTPEYRPGLMAIMDQALPTLREEADVQARRGAPWTLEQQRERLGELAKERRFVDAQRYDFWLGFPELVITSEMSIGRLDLRCCAGLVITIIARRAESEERLDELLRRLKECGAREVHVARLWLPTTDERCIALEITEGAFV